MKGKEGDFFRGEKWWTEEKGRKSEQTKEERKGNERKKERNKGKEEMI